MSTNTLVQFENIKQLVRMVEPDFNCLARIHGAVNFEREASFALQMLKDNSLLASFATSDQDSLKRAIINVAAIGLTLCPIQKLAYLLPRGKKVCLAISYRGLVRLATDVGAIRFVMAEVVCEKDTFELRGIDQEPIHRRQPFEDRGEVVGAYCVAKTGAGDFITTVMRADEIISIRDRSDSFKSGSGPWVTDRNEMIKKTVLRRAHKMWPMTDTSQRQRLEQAIDVDNDFDPTAVPALVEPDKRQEFFQQIRAMLSFLERPEEKYISHLATVYRREIKKLEDLTNQDISQAIVMLESLVEAKKARKAKEASVENAG